MEAAEFLEAVKDGNLSSMRHYTYEDLKKLGSNREKIVIHIVKENLNRRSPTTKELYYGMHFDVKVMRDLVKEGYLYNPTIMEIGREFFTRDMSGWHANEPVKSIFSDSLTSFRTGHGGISSWSRRFENPRVNIYPRHYFAAVVADGLPVYWSLFYQNPPMTVPARTV